MRFLLHTPEISAFHAPPRGTESSADPFYLRTFFRAFPYLNESDGFANQLVSDSNYLPMEVGRYVKGAFR